MANPLTEQIAQAVKAKIESVTTGNGYEVQVVECVRPTRLGGYRPRNMLVVLEQDNWRAAENGSPTNVVRRVLPMTANVYIKPSEADTTAADYYANQAEAAIEKALVADRKLGGLSQDLQMIPSQHFVTTDGAFEGIAVNFEITYRHSATNPYTAA